MNRSVKLGLDIVFGTVVPVLVLTYLTRYLGAIPAYVVSALIPVGWVLIDLLLITRRFNYITGFLGLNAAVRGVLAFWFVDGALFALKDSAGGILVTLVSGGLLLLGYPVLGVFVGQSLDPRGPEQESALARLLRDPKVARALRLGTALVVAVFAATTVVNFVLNLRIVTASFGSAEFNSQVARVNAITRFALGIPETLVIGLAMWLVFSALYSRLPDDGAGQRDFWELVAERESQGQVQLASPEAERRA